MNWVTTSWTQSDIYKEYNRIYFMSKKQSLILYSNLLINWVTKSWTHSNIYKEYTSFYCVHQIFICINYYYLCVPVRILINILRCICTLGYNIQLGVRAPIIYQSGSRGQLYKYRELQKDRGAKIIACLFRCLVRMIYYYDYYLILSVWQLIHAAEICDIYLSLYVL